MTIALVTEGISEYRITKHILTKYFKGYNEDIDINQMPPKLTEDENRLMVVPKVVGLRF